MTTRTRAFFAALLAFLLGSPSLQAHAPAKTSTKRLAEACAGRRLEVRLDAAPTSGADNLELIKDPEAAAEAEKILGGKVTPRALPAEGAGHSFFGDLFSWKRGKKSPEECLETIGKLERRFPGRVAVAPYGSKRFEKVGESIAAMTPAELKKNPLAKGVLASFFDRSGPESGALVELPAADMRDAAGFREQPAPDARPRYELPNSYRRRTAGPPGPATSVAGGVAEWAQDAWRTGWGRAGDLVSDVSQAMGVPWGGRLVNGVQLPKSGPGFRFVRYGQWGTGRMVKGIEFIGAQVAAAGGTMEVGDISYRSGGLIRRHKSHQNGRDVDIFFIGGTGSFDVAKNWRLIRAAVENPHFKATNIFVSNERRAQLLRYARSAGDPTAARAAALMSYAPGHHDHFHIRIS